MRRVIRLGPLIIHLPKNGDVRHSPLLLELWLGRAHWTASIERRP